MNGPGFLGNLLTRSRSKSFVSGGTLLPLSVSHILYLLNSTVQQTFCSRRLR